MRLSLALALSALLILTSAQGCAQKPSGANIGNPIGAPGLNQQVPVGTPFTITWTPTTPGNVALVLLRGPSTNVLPIACITESIPNTGKFVWTPPSSLEPDVTHYGLQIIQDGTGDFQYSTQFGVSASGDGPAPKLTFTTSHTHTEAKHTTTATGFAPPETKSPHPIPTTSSTPLSQLPNGQPQAPASASNATTHTFPLIISTLSLNATSLPPTHAPIPSATGIIPPHHNTTSVHLSVPTSLKTNTSSTKATGSLSISFNTKATSTATPSTSAPATQTGAAGRLGAATALVAGMGAMVAFVL